MQWWSQLWDNWAKFWGYDHWEWGTAGEWLGGIGTALALLATVHVIRADRLREKRKLADSFVTWVAGDPWKNTPHATGRMPIVVIENTGTVSVLAVHVFHFDGSGVYVIYDGSPAGSTHGSFPAGKRNEVEVKDFGYGKHDNIFISFVDANNVSWIRNAFSGKYIRRRPSPYSSIRKRVAAAGKRWLNRRSEVLDALKRFFAKQRR